VAFNAKDLVKPGDVLDGKYSVERVLGQGGMGIVVAARHKELHQRVAIKLLPPSHAKDPELVERFLREARAAARLKSEHAVKVLDVARRRNGSPFIVMELLNGEDLGAVVERGALPIPDAIDYILQACEAVAEAHALGIVHRDLKPRNLFLTSRVGGRPLVKVLDFGLAKRIDMQDRALTATSAVMGSPQYMSPEQMKASRNVDFRTDVWSLGVCLYELVSGRVPFDADAVPVLCAMVLKDPPPHIQTVRPDVPIPLWHVIEKCLQKEPGDRYTTIAELAQAIEIFAPPTSRGAAERISLVLDAPMQAPSNPPPSDPAIRLHPETGDTRTAATYDSLQRVERSSSIKIFLAAAGGVVAALGILGVILIAMAMKSPKVEAVGIISESAPGPTEVASASHRELVLLQPPTGPLKSGVAGGGGFAPTNTAPIISPPTPPKPPSSSSSATKPPKPSDPAGRM
jgi:serine/threonine protein kinase